MTTISAFSLSEAGQNSVEYTSVASSEAERAIEAIIQELAQEAWNHPILYAGKGADIGRAFITRLAKNISSLQQQHKIPLSTIVEKISTVKNQTIPPYEERSETFDGFSKVAAVNTALLNLQDQVESTPCCNNCCIIL